MLLVVFGIIKPSAWSASDISVEQITLEKFVLNNIAFNPLTNRSQISSNRRRERDIVEADMSYHMLLGTSFKSMHHKAMFKIQLWNVLKWHCQLDDIKIPTKDYVRLKITKNLTPLGPKNKSITVVYQVKKVNYYLHFMCLKG